MTKNKSVLIRKLMAAENPLVPTAAENTYINGHKNPGVSLPLAYEIEGELLHDVVVGEYMTAFRRKRNGVETPGVFETSVVQSIEQIGERAIVRTANSVYEVIPLSPPTEGIPI